MTIRGAVATLMIAAGAGLGFGAVVSLVNASRIAAIPQIIGDGWSWAAVGVVAAALAPKRPTTTVLVTLLAAVVGYYLSDLLVGVYTVIDFSNPHSATDPANAPRATDWAGAGSDLALWAVATLIICWPLSKIGVTTRRNDGWGLAARLAVPVGALIEILGWRLPLELAIQPSAITVATYITLAVLAVAAAILLCTLHIHRARARPESLNQAATVQ